MKDITEELKSKFKDLMLTKDLYPSIKGPVFELMIAAYDLAKVEQTTTKEEAPQSDVSVEEAVYTKFEVIELVTEKIKQEYGKIPTSGYITIGIINDAIPETKPTLTNHE